MAYSAIQCGKILKIQTQLLERLDLKLELCFKEMKKHTAKIEGRNRCTCGCRLKKDKNNIEDVDEKDIKYITYDI